MKKTNEPAFNENELDFQIRAAKAAYDYAWERYKLQNSFFDGINTKNSIAISLITLLLSAVTGFIYYVYKEYADKIKLSGAAELVFLAVLAIIIFLIVLAFWKAVEILNVKNVTDSASARNLIDFIKSGNESGAQFLIRLHAQLTESLASAEESIMQMNLRHAKSFKYVIAVLKIAMVLIAFIILVNIY